MNFLTNRKNIKIMITVLFCVIFAIMSVFLYNDLTSNKNVEPYAVTALSGAGTISNPYKISTKAELDFFAEQINKGNSKYMTAHIRLDANINYLNGTFVGVGLNVNANYEPNYFGGTFNGNGKTIRNIKIVRNQIKVYNDYTQYAGVGFFTGLNAGAKVENLQIENISISVKNDFVDHEYMDYFRVPGIAVGGIVGLLGGVEGSIIVRNCKVKNMSLSCTWNNTNDTREYNIRYAIGGIVGATYSTDYVSDNNCRYSITCCEVDTFNISTTFGSDYQNAWYAPAPGQPFTHSGTFDGLKDYVGAIAGFLGHYYSSGKYKYQIMNNCVAYNIGDKVKCWYTDTTFAGYENGKACWKYLMYGSKYDYSTDECVRWDAATNQSYAEWSNGTKEGNINNVNSSSSYGNNISPVFYKVSSGKYSKPTLRKFINFVQCSIEKVNCTVNTSIWLPSDIETPSISATTATITIYGQSITATSTLEAGSEECCKNGNFKWSAISAHSYKVVYTAPEVKVRWYVLPTGGITSYYKNGSQVKKFTNNSATSIISDSIVHITCGTKMKITFSNKLPAYAYSYKTITIEYKNKDEDTMKIVFDADNDHYLDVSKIPNSPFGGVSSGDSVAVHSTSGYYYISFLNVLKSKDYVLDII